MKYQTQINTIFTHKIKANIRSTSTGVQSMFKVKYHLTYGVFHHLQQKYFNAPAIISTNICNYTCLNKACRPARICQVLNFDWIYLNRARNN